MPVARLGGEEIGAACGVGEDGEEDKTRMGETEMHSYGEEDERILHKVDEGYHRGRSLCSLLST